jgi:hypothetical protein
LRPRNLLYRDALQKYIYRDLVPRWNMAPPTATFVAEQIRRTISDSRRIWRSPRELIVIAQVSHLYSSALYCKDVESGEKCFWLEGVRVRDRVHLFGRRIPFRLVEQGSRDLGDSWVGFRVPIRRRYDGKATTIRIGRCALEIPRMSLRYEVNAYEPTRR